MPKKNVDLPVRLELRLAPDDKERFTQAAKKKGLSLSAWIRSTCIEALGENDAPVKAVRARAKK